MKTTKQQMIKKLKWDEVKGRIFVNHPKERVIIWKTNKKEEVEMVIDLWQMKTLIQMIIL